MTRKYNAVLLGLLLGCGPSAGAGSSGAEGQSDSAGPKLDVSDDGASSGGGTTGNGDGCSEVVEGDVEVTDASDFEWLRTVREIEGGLTIAELTEHENLEFLECLESVQGVLVRDTESLRSFEGLARLREITGELAVRGNVSLETLTGLDSLEKVERIWIRDNPELSRLEIENPTDVRSVRLGWYDCEGAGPDATAVPRGDNPKLRGIDGFSRNENTDIRFVVEGQSGFVSTQEIVDHVLRIAPGGQVDSPSATFHLNPNLAEEDIRAIYEARGLGDSDPSPDAVCENRDDNNKCPCEAGA